MNLYFDAHIHPALKKHFATQKEDSSTNDFDNPWKTILVEDFLAGVNRLVRCILKPLVKSNLASQCSFSQIQDNQYKLLIATLFYPDIGLLNLVLSNPKFRKLIEKKKFGEVLDFKQLEKLLSSSPFDTVKRDIELFSKPNAVDETFTLLKDEDFELNEASLPHIVFSIEGLHCLRKNSKEIPVQEMSEEILTNLDSLLAQNHKIIHINLVHIDNSNDLFANQTYAVDGFRTGGFNDKPLRPKANGLTNAGKAMVNELYQRNILVDIKHLSWLARTQFYEFRQNNGLNQPIVCSHSGFAGIWFNKHGESISDFIIENDIPDEGMRNAIRLAKANPYLSDNRLGFNLSTLNLFNEDIEEILNSNGLIGITLDQRVLGFSEIIATPDQNNEPSPSATNVVQVTLGGEEIFELLTDVDFISELERPQVPQFDRKSHRFDKLKRCVLVKPRSDIAKMHAEHFYLHIVHSIEIARLIGGEASATKMLTETLCIGSDYDGLIDGLDSCPNMDSIDAFRVRFETEFPNFLLKVGKNLPNGLTIEKVAEHIFFKNGVEFVRRRLIAINNI